MPKRISANQEDKRELKSLVEEIKELRVQDVEKSDKIYSGFEMLSENIAKLSSVIESTIPKKNVEAGFQGAPDDKPKVVKEDGEKPKGFLTEASNFLNSNKGLILGGAAAAFLLNPKLALSALTSLVNVAGNLANVINKIGDGDAIGALSGIVKAITENPIITGLLGLWLAPKVKGLFTGAKKLFSSGAGAASKGLGAAAKVGETARAGITTAKNFLTSGNVMTTIADKAKDGLGAAAKVGGEGSGILSKVKGIFGKIGTLPGLKQLFKAIPGLGLILSIGSAATRLADGDILGAGIDLASGVAGLFPGVGTVAALGLQGINMARDAQAEKAKQNAANAQSGSPRRSRYPKSAPAPQGLGSAGGNGQSSKSGGKAETGSASQAMNFFMSRGWTKEQSAAIVGNLQAESGMAMKTDAVGDGGAAYGIAQWHPPRQADFKRVFGKDIRESTFQEQLQFVDWELNNTEINAGNALRGVTSAAEGAVLVDKLYERSAGLHTDRRIQNANRLMGMTDKEIAEASSNQSVQSPAANSRDAQRQAIERGETPPAPVQAPQPARRSRRTGVSAPPPNSQTSELQQGLDKAKMEQQQSSKSSVPVVVSGAPNSSSTSNVTNNNTMIINRPDYLAKEMIMSHLYPL